MLAQPLDAVAAHNGSVAVGGLDHGLVSGLIEEEVGAGVELLHDLLVDQGGGEALVHEALAVAVDVHAEGLDGVDRSAVVGHVHVVDVLARLIGLGRVIGAVAGLGPGLGVAVVGAEALGELGAGLLSHDDAGTVEVRHALGLGDVGVTTQVTGHHFLVALEAAGGNDDLLGADGDLVALSVGAHDAAGLAGLVADEVSGAGQEQRGAALVVENLAELLQVLVGVGLGALLGGTTAAHPQVGAAGSELLDGEAQAADPVDGLLPVHDHGLAQVGIGQRDLGVNGLPVDAEARAKGTSGETRGAAHVTGGLNEDGLSAGLDGGDGCSQAADAGAGDNDVARVSVAALGLGSCLVGLGLLDGDRAGNGADAGDSASTHEEVAAGRSGVDHCDLLGRIGKRVTGSRSPPRRQPPAQPRLVRALRKGLPVLAPCHIPVSVCPPHGRPLRPCLGTTIRSATHLRITDALVRRPFPGLSKAGDPTPKMCVAHS